MYAIKRYGVIKVETEIEQGLYETKRYCYDPSGLPFHIGNGFIDHKTAETSGELTVQNYLNDTLMLLSYFADEKNQIDFLAPCKEIRAAAKKYIESELGWQVKLHRNGNFIIERPKFDKATNQTIAKIRASTLRNRLKSWKDFYKFLIEIEKIYDFENPFDWTLYKNPTSNFHPTMPPESGMSLPNKRRHMDVNSYFCVIGDDWEPVFIDDPELPSKLYSILHNFDQVYRCILHVLFESGCRKHEALNISIGDCRDKNPTELGVKSISKGSFNVKVKHLNWSVSTERMIRNYINHERRKHDHFHRNIDELEAHEPLFINRNGNRITPGGFYKQFRNICSKAKIAVTVHQIRHWFVTTNLQKINELPDKSKRQDFRRKFIRYMGWRNRETIKVYDHYLGDISDEELHDIFNREYKPNTMTMRRMYGEPELTPEEIAKVTEFQKFLNQEFDDEFNE